MLLCLLTHNHDIRGVCTSAGPSEEASDQPRVGWEKCEADSFSGQLLPKMCQCREDTGRLQPLHSTAGPNMIKAKAFHKHLAQAVHAFQLSYTYAQGVICRHFPGSVPSRSFAFSKMLPSKLSSSSISPQHFRRTLLSVSLSCHSRCLVVNQRYRAQHDYTVAQSHKALLMWSCCNSLSPCF